MKLKNAKRLGASPIKGRRGSRHVKVVDIPNGGALVRLPTGEIARVKPRFRYLDMVEGVQFLDVAEGDHPHAPPRDDFMKFTVRDDGTYHVDIKRTHPVLTGYVIKRSPVVKRRRHGRDEVTREPTVSTETPILRAPAVDFSAETARLGLPIEPTTDPKRANDILQRIAEDALDLFGSVKAGMTYLLNKNFDGAGQTGLELVKDRGLPAILMKLDELRFGFAG